MADNDVMSLRLDPELWQQIELAVRVLDQTKSDFVRDAVRIHLARIKSGDTRAVSTVVRRHRARMRRLHSAYPARWRRP